MGLEVNAGYIVSSFFIWNNLSFNCIGYDLHHHVTAIFHLPCPHSSFWLICNSGLLKPPRVFTLPLKTKGHFYMMPFLNTEFSTVKSFCLHRNLGLALVSKSVLFDLHMLFILLLIFLPCVVFVPVMAFRSLMILWRPKVSHGLLAVKAFTELMTTITVTIHLSEVIIPQILVVRV